MLRGEIVPWDVREALTGSLTAGESMEDSRAGPGGRRPPRARNARTDVSLPPIDVLPDLHAVTVGITGTKVFPAKHLDRVNLE